MGEDLQEDDSPNLRGRLRNPSDSVVVSQWMQGRKKGMLASHGRSGGATFGDAPGAAAL